MATPVERIAAGFRSPAPGTAEPVVVAQAPAAQPVDGRDPPQVGARRVGPATPSLDRAPRVTSVGSDQLAAAIARAQRSSLSLETVNSGGPSRGAGTIVRQGYATTAAHMVDPNQPVYYAALDAQGRRVVGKATVVGVARDLDIALLRLEHGDLPAASFGRQAPRQGDTIIVVGDPRGFEQSATVGVVSGLHRDLGQVICDCVQTDAPINLGNSGGGAFNQDGDLVGQVVGLLEGDQSLGFVTSAAVLERVVDRLMRGNLVATDPGFVLGNLTLAQTYGSGRPFIDGPVVTSTRVPGLQQYDRVVGIDGQRVSTIAEARTFLALIEPGQSYRMTVIRGNRSLELTLTKPPR